MSIHIPSNTFMAIARTIPGNHVCHICEIPDDDTAVLSQHLSADKNDNISDENFTEKYMQKPNKPHLLPQEDMLVAPQRQAMPVREYKSPLPKLYFGGESTNIVDSNQTHVTFTEPIHNTKLDLSQLKCDSALTSEQKSKLVDIIIKNQHAFSTGLSVL